MKDAEIIELDEPEAAAAPWRAGSLTMVAAPLLVVAALVSALVLSGGRPARDQAALERSVEPTPHVWSPSGAPAGVVFFTRPPDVATPAAVQVIDGESGDPEMLATQPWTGLGPTYSARGDVAEAELDGDAYVIGGTGSSEDGRMVIRYDRRTGMRLRAADLPVSVDHAMAATLGGRIFVFGGFVFGQPSARVFSLGSNDSAWVEHTPMPAPRAAGGAAVMDERVYIVGGVGTTGNQFREIWMYDMRGRWDTSLARMPTPRDHLAVGTYAGRICAAGGNGGERVFECYEPIRNEWAAMPDLRKPAVGARAAEAAGWFWVIAQDVHIFAIDHWHFGPRLLTPRAGHAVVMIDGSIYVFEGSLGNASVRSEVISPRP